MIKIKHAGNFNNTNSFLKRVGVDAVLKVFNKYGEIGVLALAFSTPIDSGETKNSWDYEIKRSSKAIIISWTNSHVDKGVPIAIILQYGHATINGGYVQGRDYINPAIKPVFDQMANDIWVEITKL